MNPVLFLTLLLCGIQISFCKQYNEYGTKGPYDVLLQSKHHTIKLTFVIRRHITFVQELKYSSKGGEKNIITRVEITNEGNLDWETVEDIRLSGRISGVGTDFLDLWVTYPSFSQDSPQLNNTRLDLKVEIWGVPLDGMVEPE